MSIFYGWSGRFIRAAVAVIIAGLASVYGDNATYMIIAPIIQSFFKWLRDSYGVDLKII